MPNAIIFCSSYGQITYALQLMLQNIRERSVTLVLSDFPDLFRFFDTINKKTFNNEIDIIHLEDYLKNRVSGTGRWQKIIGAIPDMILERRYLKKLWRQHFASQENGDVFFISPGSNGLVFYMIDRLRKNNRLVYVSPPPPYLDEYIPVNPKDLAKLIVSKVIYGWGLAVSRVTTYNGFPCISSRFVNHHAHRVIDSEAEGLMKSFDYSRFRVFETGDYDVIYFDDNLIGNGYTKGSLLFKREINAIFNILAKYFPQQKIAYKYHPGYSGDETLIETGVKLPSFIPSEFLSPGKTRLYLSAFSWSIAHTKTGVAVSIGNLITFQSDIVRNKLADALIAESHSKVLFPRTLAEFEQIVAGLK